MTSSGKTYVVVFQLEFTAVRTLVQAPRPECDQADNDDGQQAASDTGVQTRLIRRVVLRPTDC
jgi:hypothetical protein